MKKILIPMFLALSLVSCSNGNSGDGGSTPPATDNGDKTPTQDGGTAEIPGIAEIKAILQHQRKTLKTYLLNR